MTGYGARTNDPHFVALDEAEDDPHERDLIRELNRCLDVCDTLAGIEAEGGAAISNQHRRWFWSAFVAGGRTRHAAIRELRLTLLDWLEVPHASADELRERQAGPDAIVPDEVVGLWLDQANLRDKWVPRLRAVLFRGATTGRATATVTQPRPNPVGTAADVTDTGGGGQHGDDGKERARGHARARRVSPVPAGVTPARRG